MRGESIEVGRALIDGEVAPEAAIRFPLKTANRHGLVAGATGTGKTTLRSRSSSPPQVSRSSPPT